MMDEVIDVQIIPVHAVKGLHPALEAAALALSGIMSKKGTASFASKHQRILDDIAPVLVLVTPAKDGYWLITPLDWMPVVEKAGFRRLIAAIVQGVDAEKALEMAAQNWLVHHHHHLHHVSSREELAKAYLQIIEIATGAYPPNHRVAWTLDISEGPVKRAKRALRARR